MITIYFIILVNQYLGSQRSEAFENNLTRKESFGLSNSNKKSNNFENNFTSSHNKNIIYSPQPKSLNGEISHNMMISPFKTHRKKESSMNFEQQITIPKLSLHGKIMIKLKYFNIFLRK